MASQDLVVHQGGAVAVTGALGISDVQRVGNLLAASGYFADAKEMAQAAVKVMAGQELGIPPVAAMMGINIIKGKVALGGNLIAAQIKKHGYDYKHVRFDEKGCVLRFLSKVDATGKREVLGESSFTEEDAKTAGVYGDMYRKYPRNMYFNRAISNGAKWYTPDVFNGVPPYTPEELGARVDSDGEFIHEGGSAAAQADVVEGKLLDGGMPPAQAKAESDRHPGRNTSPKSEVPDEIKALWARMNGRYEALDVFGELKGALHAICGEEAGEVHYRRILSKHGVEKSDQFKTIGHSRACAREMYEEVRRLEAQFITPKDMPEATEDGKLFDTEKDATYAHD